MGDARRRAWWAAVVGSVVALLLSGCTLLGEISGGGDELVGESTAIVYRDAPRGFTNVEFERGEVLITPIGEVRLHTTRTGTEIPGDEASFNAPNEDLPHDRDAPYTAPEGMQYLYVELDVEIVMYPRLDGKISGVTYELRVDGGENTSTTFPISNIESFDGYLLLVPEQVETSTAVLEVEAEGYTQQLSLIDGTRLPSELDSMYESQMWVDLGTADDMVSTSFTRDDGSEEWFDTLVESVEITPFLNGYGYTDPGSEYLRVVLTHSHVSSSAEGSLVNLPPGQDTGYVLRLPDGTEIEPESHLQREHAYSSRNHTVELWFLVQNDVTEAELVMQLDPFPRYDDYEQQLDSLDVTFPVEFGVDA